MPAEKVRAHSACVPGWTGVAELKAAAQRSWDRGELLREAIRPTGAYPRRRPLRRPTATQLRDDYAAARAWAAELHAAAGADGSGPFSLETAEVGRTTIGANLVPAAAVFASPADEAGFIGRRRDLESFSRLAEAVRAAEPGLEEWLARRPLHALEVRGDLPDLVRAARWFADHPAPGVYLRQLSLPGIHTKFLETRRRTLDELVTALDPDRPAGGFEARHGLLTEPAAVRFRLLDPALAFPGGATDVVLRVDEFARLRLPLRTVIVVENKVTFLSLPPLPGALAVFGAGFGSGTRVPAWLAAFPLLYWGDLDSHGFAVLDQLRASHPHVESLLMDGETLAAHAELWVEDPRPTRAALTRLTGEEGEVYAALTSGDLVPDGWAGVRLEQEYVRWDWALDRITAAASGRGA